MRRYIACLLTLGASCAFVQYADAQIQMPAPKTFGQPVAQMPSLAAAPRGPTIRKISVPAEHVRSVATSLSMRYRDVPGVQITPDVQKQNLIVLAPKSAQDQIAEDVKALMSKDSVRHADFAAVGPLKVQLRHISWGDFEQFVKVANGGPIAATANRKSQTVSYQLTGMPLRGTTVSIDRKNNVVSVAAPETSLDGWRTLIGALDQPKAQGIYTEVVRIGVSEPAPIQKAFRLLRSVGVEPAKAKVPKRKKSLFRTAAFQDQSPADDAGDPPADDAAAANDTGGALGNAQIQFVPELGQIIIKGTDQEIARIKEVISQIEQANTLTRPEIEVLNLTHADCNAVATLLTQLYDDVLSARQGEVNISSLDVPNALLLIGRKEAIDSLKELVAKIDVPVSPASRLRVFRLQHASAADAEEAIRNFVAEGETDGARPALGLRVRLYSDFRTNSLIVNASPRDMTEITRLINELDVENATITNEIKIFQLNNASAEDLQATLQEAIDGGDGGNDNVTPPSSSLSIVAIDASGNRIINSGILVGATVTADSGANALVVRAPSSSMPLIAELIRQLDRAPGIDSLVKVFTIENGDATQLATTLTDLFGDEAATSGTQIGAGNLAGLPAATAAGDSTLVPLRFSVDARTNSIVVSGAGSDLDVVESILLRLDSEGFAERITEVIWLRHGLAQPISDAVTNYVNERQTSQNTIQQYQQGLGPYDLIDRDLIVIPEIDSNSLLLSVSPRLYEDVRRLIDQLDRRRPMIMIKAMMAEVTLDDTFEIGGELGLQDSLLFNRGLAVDDGLAIDNLLGTNTVIGGGNPGFNFNNNGLSSTNNFRSGNVAARGVSTFGLGLSNDAVGYGGFVLNAASESVSLLMRTLHDAGRLQILSRPQLTTLDNTESIVSVGSRVARITGVVVNQNGNTLDTEDIDVGLILRVAPRVGADGLITMDIDVTRSQRDPNNGTPIPDGAGGFVLINDILQTVAQSTLTAYSGQTVVFGGLIQKQRTNVSRRVPGLADIPLIGNAFKYDTETETRNELLVIMTPMIVNGSQDLEYIKQVESSRMSWCLADVVEAHGDVGLNGGYGLWGPAVGNTIYPDLQPTVQREQVISDQPMIQGPGVNQPMVETVDPAVPTSSANGYQVVPGQQAIDMIHGSAPVVIEDANGVVPELGPDPAFGQGVPAGVVDEVAPAPAFRDGAAFAPRRSVLPVSWINKRNSQKQSGAVATAGKNATLAPTRLGSKTSDRSLGIPAPTETVHPTKSSELIDDDSEGLLPSISPLNWIR